MNDSSGGLSSEATRLRRLYSPSELAQLARLIAPVPDSGSMTAEEFERVVQVLGGKNRYRPFSSKSMSAARLVLVMGASVAEAATEVGLSRQVVHRHITRIQARMAAVPDKWVKVEAWVPPVAALRFPELVVDLIADHEH